MRTVRALSPAFISLPPLVGQGKCPVAKPLLSRRASGLHGATTPRVPDRGLAKAWEVGVQVGVHPPFLRARGPGRIRPLRIIIIRTRIAIPVRVIQRVPGGTRGLLLRGFL